MPGINDPLVFARDDNGDIEIPLRKAAGLEAVFILVRAALLLWRDEWFLNRDVGMPWLETPDGVVSEQDAILGQVFDPAKTARAVRREILAVPGVVEVPELRTSYDGETRNLSIEFRVKVRFDAGAEEESELQTVALAA